MKRKKFLWAFTLIELLVVISIIAILAGIALPVFSQVQIKGAQTKALSNAKQIGLALKVYATDNNGIFPSYNLTSTSPVTLGTTAVTDSNTAFAQLFPQYLTNETIFWVAKAAECNPAPPDNVIDNPITLSHTATSKTLAKGENHWAYVLALNDTSNASFPLLADAFAAVAASQPGHSTYTTTPGTIGGLWTGTKAVVIRVDCSGAIEKVDPSTQEVLNGDGTDLFQSTSNWLTTTNAVVNPL